MINLLPTGIWMALIAMILLSAFLLMFDYWRRSRPRPLQTAAPFTARPVLTREEAELFHQIEQLLPLGHRVMIQFPYAGMLEGGTRSRFHAINIQCADLAIVDAGFNVVAVINYQPIGHVDAIERDVDRASMREVQNTRALTEAGLPLLRIPADYTNATIKDMLHALLAERRAPS